MVLVYKKRKKYNEIQLTKKQNGFKQSKNDKSSPSPDSTLELVQLFNINNYIFSRKCFKNEIG